MIRVKRLSVHIFKVLSGILLGYLASGFTDHLDLSWILISVFLVLSPEGGDAVELAVTRIKANLVGACTGFALVTFEVPLVFEFILGAVTALIICEIIGLNMGARASLAAMVIVLMEQGEHHIWTSAFHRVISVFLGCLIGLLVTYFIHSVLKLKVTEQAVTPNKEREA